MEKHGLHQLLALLGPDTASASAEYRRLHERVARYFELNGVEDPEALADIAMDRMAARALHAEEDPAFEVQNPPAFLLGIARLLLQEDLRRRQKVASALREWTTMEIPPAAEKEAMDRALTASLAELPEEKRILIHKYYIHPGHRKIAAHQKLAEELGISLNALRNRVMRTRQDLEKIIRMHLQKDARDV